MKKLILGFLVLLASITWMPVSATGTPDPVTSRVKVPSEQAQTLITRLKEIEAIDRSTLTRYEKKQLRKEVRQIDKQLRAISGGVYISAGTIILILILLLIFT